MTIKNPGYVLLIISLQIITFIPSVFGNSQIGNDTVLYFAFGDSVAVYKNPDDSKKPICYTSWRDTLWSNNYYVVHYTDALTHIEKLDKKDYRVEYGWWEWANVKINGFDSVWIQQEWNNISLSNKIKRSPSGKYHSFNQCHVGDGFWYISPTVILDSSDIRVSPILYHNNDSVCWIKGSDMMVLSQSSDIKKFANMDYYLHNNIIYVYDGSIQDTSFLAFGFGPVYSERSKRIIFLKEKLINESEKEIQLCSIGLDGNSFTIIKSLNISDYGLIQSNCMGYDAVESSKIEIQQSESSELYKFKVFYIYDCEKYSEDEEDESLVIVIDSNGEFIY